MTDSILPRSPALRRKTRQTRHSWREVDGILLLDKPVGLSSNTALQKARQLYAADKAGHTGSLDPLATGLLPICFGQATKISALMLEADKRYRANVRLGIKTSSGDAEGEIIEKRPYAPLDADAIAAAIPALLGDIDQIPPMYSAVKLAGTHLYELARQGIEDERTPRRVRIHALVVTGVSDQGFEFEVHCSKGTYIRTLAEDWAAQLEQVGHLTALRRLTNGPFRLEDAVTDAELQAAAGDQGVLDALLKPIASALVGWTRLAVDRRDAIRLRRGLDCGPYPDAEPGAVLVVDEAGLALFIAEVDAHRRLWPKRWIGPAHAVSMP